MNKLREKEKNGEINLSKTQVIGFSAITLNQFKQSHQHELFDSFCNYNLPFNKFYSGKTNRL